MRAGKVEPGAAISCGKTVLVGPNGTGHALNAVQKAVRLFWSAQKTDTAPANASWSVSVMAATLFAACRTNRVGEIQSSTQPVGVLAKTGCLVRRAQGLRRAIGFSTADSYVSHGNSVLGACAILTSAVQHRETGRLRGGEISVLRLGLSATWLGSGHSWRGMSVDLGLFILVGEYIVGQQAKHNHNT